jgi:hypothetical protein
MESEFDLITVKIQDNTTFDMDDITIPDYSWASVGTLTPNSGTIELTGEDADIVIDGTSLKKTLQGINDRLAILQVNPELEAEFDELHAVAEQYRALEKKLLEKKKVWAALNKT